VTTHTDYELNRAAALTHRDGRPRWVDDAGRIHTHRPDGAAVRVQLTRGGAVAYAHQPARDY